VTTCASQSRTFPSQELPPDGADTEALTTFYTTLLQQRPDSEMAARFCVQYGLLPEDEAKVLAKKFAKTSGAKSTSKPASKVRHRHTPHARV
jgi:hypothetical protein